MLAKHSLNKADGIPRAEIGSARWLNYFFITFALVVIVWTIALKATSDVNSSFSTSAITEDTLDRSLQRAATTALGERRGTIIIMDPQTGRIRAIVNPKLAFEENLPPGSTIKPFTALAALRSGLINQDSRNACREEYSHDEFHTVCSHPRGLPPLNPTEAIAYSCNYYFGRLGERLNEPAFVSLLSEFGFGRKTGVNADGESPGKLLRNGWRSQNAIGESDNFLATPIQIINAYSALMNGGHLLTPGVGGPEHFVPKLQANLTIKDDQREIIVKGMRGAVRYGTAETAGLYKLPGYIFGKTGTATQINGFRSQGWFIGFASDASGENDSRTGPERVKLAVLVFLTKAHGSEAAEIARPIFEEFSQIQPRRLGDTAIASQHENDQRTDPSDSSSSNLAVSPSQRLPFSFIRLHLVRENVTQTIPLEDYVRSVVATEGSTENELESLKALAIASRTYAVKNMGRHERDGYDFCSTTHCQRYRPTGSQSDTYIAPAVTEAVEATRGEILRDSGGNVADSYFSASCGGATANMSTLWGGSAPPYLRGVQDEYCSNEPHHSWTDVISHGASAEGAAKRPAYKYWRTTAQRNGRQKRPKRKGRTNCPRRRSTGDDQWMGIQDRCGPCTWLEPFEEFAFRDCSFRHQLCLSRPGIRPWSRSLPGGRTCDGLARLQLPPNPGEVFSHHSDRCRWSNRFSRPYLGNRNSRYSSAARLRLSLCGQALVELLLMPPAFAGKRSAAKISASAIPRPSIGGRLKGF